jgi:hypothetical protein
MSLLHNSVQAFWLDMPADSSWPFIARWQSTGFKSSSPESGHVSFSEIESRPHTVALGPERFGSQRK